MCQFGLVADSNDMDVKDNFLKKPTVFLTSSAQIAEELSEVCDGSHEHTQCKGGRVPRKAAEYTEELCMVICTGLKRHLAVEVARTVSSVPLSKAGSRTVISSLLQKPGHWKDTKHEEDGGCDIR